jgi:predicted anti-sigma-YlaC factor YlaD
MNRAAHLSDEALNDLLIGTGSAEAEQHLAGCAECRGRVDAFNADLKLLDETSMAWSRVRAAGMAELPAPSGMRRAPLATMGWMAAGLLLLALAVPVWHSGNHHTDQTKADQTKADQAKADQAKAGSMAPVGPSNEESEAQIAADNQLLHEVDAVMNTDEASPFGETLRSDRSHARHRARPE